MNNTLNIENLLPDFELLDTFGVEPAENTGGAKITIHDH
jgi:hypothetical protein